MHTGDSLGKIRQGLKVLTFLLNKELLAVPVSDITEVNRIARLKRVKKAPDFVIGLINFHGKTTPVLNLKQLLSFEPRELGQKAMWFAVKHGETFVCLAMDKVGKFIDLDRQILDEMPTLADSPEVKYIKCYARVNNELMPVLDVKNIIREREQEVLSDFGF